MSESKTENANNTIVKKRKNKIQLGSPEEFKKMLDDYNDRIKKIKKKDRTPEDNEVVKKMKIFNTRLCYQKCKQSEEYKQIFEQRKEKSLKRYYEQREKILERQRKIRMENRKENADEKSVDKLKKIIDSNPSILG